MNLALKTLRVKYDILLSKTNILSGITADMNEKLPKLKYTITDLITEINTIISNKNYDMLILNREIEHGMTNLSQQIAIELYIIILW